MQCGKWAVNATVGVGLAVLVMVASGLAGFLPTAPAHAQPVSAQNVTSVNYPGGQFQKTGPKTWTENNGAFNFTEVGRDGTSVTLLDASRGVQLLLNIDRKQIFISGGGAKPALLYRIVSVSGAAAPQAQLPQKPGPKPQPPVQQPNSPAAFQSTMVTAHNTYRTKHCVPAVTWNAGLAASAQQWANACKFQHAQGGGFGENLFAGTATTAQGAVDGWYAEISKYNFAAPGWKSGVGHFTQLIWRNTTQIGCAVAACNAGTVFPNSKSFFYVCRYSPAGNVTGAEEAKNFAANVPATCK